MMKNALYRSLIWLSLFLIGCKEDPCKDREYQPINPVIADHIPYSDGQTVKFKTSDGGNFTAIAERVSEVNRPDAPLICQDYLYVTLKTGGSLFAEYVERGSVVKDNILQLSLYTLRTGSGDGLFISVSDDGIMYSEMPSTQSVQHTTLEIDGISYNEVLEITYDVESFPKDEDLTQIFYNKTHGIIQYTTYNGLVTTRVD